MSAIKDYEAVPHATNQREVFLDSIKGLLIVCVVFGYVAIPVVGHANSLTFIYRTIYLFHMPLFVFVSGYLSKGITKGGLRVDRICSLIVLLFAYRIVLQMTEAPLSVEFFAKKILYSGGAPWYLMSFATWYMLVPVFERMKPAVAISALLALCAGAYSQVGSVLSVSDYRLFALLSPRLLLQ